MPSKQLDVESVGEVTLYRSFRATRFRIAIRPDGTVRVSLPWLASFRSGEQFLMQHLDWIIQTKKRVAQKNSTPPMIRPGLLFETRDYQYQITPAPVLKCRILRLPKEKKIDFQFPERGDITNPELQHELRILVERALRFEAKHYLPSRLAEWAFKLGYSYNRVTIKNNKSNWGSCSTKGNINLNLHLMRLPDRLIDYVLIHELVHTVVPNHSEHFKQRLRNHLPEASLLEKELKTIRTTIGSTNFPAEVSTPG